MTCSSARPPAAAGTSSTCRSTTTARRSIPTTSRLRDGVADNLRKYDLTESETLLFGSNFGVTPEVKESPTGSLIVASSSLGTVFEIRKKDK